ncbi:hypothetical protein EVC45_40370 [Paraburkholderia sp. UYCP14C]|uniref:hypothetical protein n=1 Tax=Paraburkholderia sp. UYCP14C TaxID=2511130 RepID=UPI0010207553|nr:hypothetical protein [Paraburkholderia sp. UYCP14C]RZF24137.1 hypothetical protein EVC45_40370 [Paraburkholderia sp. UYCP14C]
MLEAFACRPSIIFPMRDGRMKPRIASSCDRIGRLVLLDGFSECVMDLTRARAESEVPGGLDS